jgi:hypothetical protein
VEVLARQAGPGGWLQTHKDRLDAFIIADTAKAKGQREMKGAWMTESVGVLRISGAVQIAGQACWSPPPDISKHIGQQACEQLQGTGFTKQQVYNRRKQQGNNWGNQLSR